MIRSAESTAPLSRWFGCVTLLVLLTAAPGSAQTIFNPVISIGSFYTNNVDYVGEPSKDKESSGYYLGLTLPLTRQTRYGSYTAMYSTSYEDFSDVELDNGRHYFNFSYGQRRAERGSLQLHLRYNFTEDQGNRKSLATNQLFLSPRVQREFADVGFNWGRRLGARYNLRLLGRVSTWQYDNFVEGPEGEIPRGFRDRDAYRLGVGLSKNISRSFRFGFAYGFRHFELSNFGQQDVHSYSLTLGYRLAQVLNFNVAMGGFQRTSTNVANETANKSGFQLALNLGKAWRFRTVVLGVRVAHAPNVGGGAQVGTATVSRAGFFLRPGQSRGRRNWSWGFYANWARRDPVSKLQRSIENVSLGANFFYSLGRIVGITLSSFWVDQESQSQIQKGKFIRVNLGLSIRPFGSTRMATP